MTAASSPSIPVWPAVWKLARLRVRISINSFRHSRLRSKILTTVGLLGLLAFAAAVFVGSWGIMRVLRSPELVRSAGIDISALFQSMAPLILTGLFFGILFTSFGVLLQALYLAGDMDFLLAAPVPIRAVFITKLTQAILPNLGLSALFGLPILYGLGASGGYNLIYYPLVIVVMVCLTFAAAGLAALLVMGVVRIISPRRAAEILGFVGATAGIICSQIGNLSESLGGRVGYAPSLVGGASSLALRLRTPWVPLNWAGQSLVDLGEGHWMTGSGLLMLTLVWTALVFWLSLVTAERLYYSGWAGMQVVARKSRSTDTARMAGLRTASPSRIERYLPGPVRAILQKDFILLGRDLRNVAQLISPLIIGVALTVSFLRAGGRSLDGTGDIPGWVIERLRPLSGFENVTIAVFVGWLLLGRLAGMSFSREGKNFWMLKASPISATQMLAAKFLGAYLPALGLGYLFVLGTSLFHRPLLGQVPFMMAVITLSLSALTGILIAFGAAGANFKWDDPRRMNAGGIGCLGQVVTIAFLPISLALFIGPLLVVVAIQLPLYYGYLAGLLLGMAGNLACTFLPLMFVQRTVQRLDES